MANLLAFNDVSNAFISFQLNSKVKCPRVCFQRTNLKKIFFKFYYQNIPKMFFLLEKPKRVKIVEFVNRGSTCTAPGSWLEIISTYSHPSIQSEQIEIIILLKTQFVLTFLDFLFLYHPPKPYKEEQNCLTKYNYQTKSNCDSKSNV